MPTTFARYFTTLAQHSAELICVTGPDQILRYVSPSAEAILGWMPEDMCGKGPEDLLHPDDVETARAAGARDRRLSGFRGTGVCVRWLRKDGRYAWMDVNASLVRNQDTGDLMEVVLVMRDVSSRMEEEQRLRELTVTDGLTSLLNRRGFDEVLEKAWHQTMRDNTRISLLLLDIDHFKSFNDSFGHQRGDECLKAVAAAVRRCLQRSADGAARYGGEEFSAILPNTDAEGAMVVAERIRLAIQALRIPNPACSAGYGYLSVSVGVACAAAHMDMGMRTPQSLVLTADTALYKAKKKGRNRLSLMLLVGSCAD